MIPRLLGIVEMCCGGEEVEVLRINSKVIDIFKTLVVIVVVTIAILSVAGILILAVFGWFG